MDRLSKPLRWAKWCGAVACAGLFLLFFVSITWLITYGTPGWQRMIGIGCGDLVYVSLPGNLDPFQFSSMEGGWRVSSRGLTSERMEWRLRYYQGPTGHWWLVLPLWLPLLLLAIPTGYLFWRDRASPPGHCRRCRYDLTANTSGRCPECGTTVIS